MKYLLSAITIFLFAFLIFGCALTKPLDRAIASALAKTAARSDLDTLSYRAGYNAGKGAREQLLSDSTSIKVAALLDLLDQKLQHASSGMMRNITDSVQYRLLLQALGSTLSDEINNKVLGIQTEKRLESIRDAVLTKWVVFLEREIQQNLLGEPTRLRLASLRNELLGDSTRQLVGQLRSELTGPETARQLADLVSAALNPSIEKLDRTVNANLKVTQKYANEIILAVLIAALIIIGWVWRQRLKYLNLVKLLTVQINSIPSQKDYDELTHRIQNEAIKNSMEPVLKEVLKSQGL